MWSQTWHISEISWIRAFWKFIKLRYLALSVVSYTIISALQDAFVCSARQKCQCRRVVCYGVVGQKTRLLARACSATLLQHSLPQFVSKTQSMSVCEVGHYSLVHSLSISLFLTAQPSLTVRWGRFSKYGVCNNCSLPCLLVRRSSVHHAAQVVHSFGCLFCTAKFDVLVMH